LEKENADTDEKIICVFRTDIGFRGWNDHTGDWTGEPTEGGNHIYAKFPGEILVKGVIAQGDAGRMRSGYQLVALMPKGIVFRTFYGGRLFGKPGEHYYRWDGKQLVSFF